MQGQAQCIAKIKCLNLLLKPLTKLRRQRFFDLRRPRPWMFPGETHYRQMTKRMTNVTNNEALLMCSGRNTLPSNDKENDHCHQQ
ncbi:hypothetical protein LSAT2_009400 [Lamellibrachia satsuma]|nr:hypothetical protein LSAT2_009400 [Lamellibrachia satsuma]